MPMRRPTPSPSEAINFAYGRPPAAPMMKPRRAKSDGYPPAEVISQRLSIPAASRGRPRRLNIAQPALSQQLQSLEAHFRQKLLIRSQQGVTPTEAGRVLYRHAQAILKQFEQAEADVKRSSTSLSGHVSVGLAPYSAGGTLSLALLKAARESHPDIMLHIVEGFAVAFSELIMNGRIDMAVMQGAGPMRGVSFQPLAGRGILPGDAGRGALPRRGAERHSARRSRRHPADAAEQARTSCAGPSMRGSPASISRPTSSPRWNRSARCAMPWPKAPGRPSCRGRWPARSPRPRAR